MEPRWRKGEGVECSLPFVLTRITVLVNSLIDEIISYRQFILWFQAAKDEMNTTSPGWMQAQRKAPKSGGGCGIIYIVLLSTEALLSVQAGPLPFKIFLIAALLILQAGPPLFARASLPTHWRGSSFCQSHWLLSCILEQENWQLFSRIWGRICTTSGTMTEQRA